MLEWLIPRSAVCLFAISLSGCELIGGFQDFHPRSRDAGAAGTAGHTSRCDAGTGTPSIGPALLPIDNGSGCFWIDATEVTVQDYTQFLAAGVPAQLDPQCAGNTSFVPAAPGDAGDAGENCKLNEGEILSAGEHPVTCVDWCDADAYCRWAGKSLCADDFASPALLSRSDWYAACANGSDQTDYPYRAPNDYDPRACNGVDNGSNECAPSHNCTTRSAGSLLSCRNDVGVADLSGNAAEWTNACADTSENAICKVRGGSFRSESDGLRCDTTREYPRLHHDASIGFRCCWYPR